MCPWKRAKTSPPLWTLLRLTAPTMPWPVRAAMAVLASTGSATARVLVGPASRWTELAPLPPSHLAKGARICNCQNWQLLTEAVKLRWLLEIAASTRFRAKVEGCPDSTAFSSSTSVVIFAGNGSLCLGQQRQAVTRCVLLMCPSCISWTVRWPRKQPRHLPPPPFQATTDVDH